MGLTLLSALIPGLGFAMGGRAKLGAFIMTLSVGLLAIALLRIRCTTRSG